MSDATRKAIAERLERNRTARQPAKPKTEKPKPEPKPEAPEDAKG